VLGIRVHPLTFDQVREGGWLAEGIEPVVLGVTERTP